MEKLSNFFTSLRIQLNLSPKQAVTLILLALLLLGSSLYVWLSSQPEEIIISPQKRQVRVKKQTQELVFVHVAGEVQKPGVYRLPKGSRLILAIRAAGGETTNANLNALNLAARLTDGQKIFVPAKGAPANSANPDSTQPGGLLNLNTASQAELEALPGVGPVIAKQIVAYREKHGSFTSVNQLDNVKGIGPQKFAELKELVTVY